MIFEREMQANTHLLPYHLGCPMWAHKAWTGVFFSEQAKREDFLPQYSSVFNSVEGNVTFYGLPEVGTLKRWGEQVPEDFRFCFKFPRVLSHDLMLRHARRETGNFLSRMSVLGERLGPLFLQLPPQFDPAGLEHLRSYLQELPSDFHYALELRHEAFFEEALLRELDMMLTDLDMDRVVFDTRALFSGEAVDEDVVEARRKKPRLPVVNRALGRRPFVRWVGHPQAELNTASLREWQACVARWLREGREPYMFIHMPDDTVAPQWAKTFHEGLMVQGVDIPPMPAWPIDRLPKPAQQMDLF